MQQPRQAGPSTTCSNQGLCITRCQKTDSFLTRITKQHGGNNKDHHDFITPSRSSRCPSPSAYVSLRAHEGIEHSSCLVHAWVKHHARLLREIAARRGSLKYVATAAVPSTRLIRVARIHLMLASSHPRSELHHFTLCALLNISQGPGPSCCHASCVGCRFACLHTLWCRVLGESRGLSK